MAIDKEIKMCQSCEKDLHLWEDDVVAISRLPKKAKMTSSVYYFHKDCFWEIAGEEFVPGGPNWHPDWAKED